LTRSDESSPEFGRAHEADHRANIYFGNSGTQIIADNKMSRCCRQI
jgi:hypothetical protein